eukprot:m.103556 g.103556  ORF g.103556 m.103556 type:complete len:76 (-) comp13244_c0_seq5:268-495(-)
MGLQITQGPLMRGAFDWGLNFIYLSLPSSTSAQTIKPFRSPAMAGTAFALYKTLLKDLGNFDDVGVFLCIFVWHT